MVDHEVEHTKPSDPGGTYVAYTWERDVDLLTGALVPAAPGYSVVMVDDERHTVFTAGPVLAWCVAAGASMPVTADGLVDINGQDFGILEPNGEVERPFVCRYPNIEASGKPS
jgi:hypothetical protein